MNNSIGGLGNIWAITNINSCFLEFNQNLIKVGGFGIIIDSKKFQSFSDKDISIIIDGFVLPKIDFFQEYSLFKQNELIFTLYKKYGLEFVKKLKGNFTIIIVDHNCIYMVNDHHSFKKFFIYQNGKDILISNSLFLIASKVDLELDRENVALFCLLEHFVEGMTMFKNLSFSKPSTRIKFGDKNYLNIGNYLEEDHFSSLEKNNYDYDTFAKIWTTLLSQYVYYLKPKDISLTITGGNDSRMILSGLLKEKIKVNLFSFGNPNSFDVKIAQKISKVTGLPYANYCINQPTKNWQEEYSREIITFGNSLINLHRAHRLDAINREIENHPDVEMVLGGFMGGDYIKGLKYEDYITSRLIREIEYNGGRKNLKNIVEELLTHNFINKDNLNLSRLLERIENLSFIDEQVKNHREFLVLYRMIGSIHDMQDINVFASKVPYVVNPFMDIDFMETFFASKYSPLNNEVSKIGNRLKIKRSLFHLTITNLLAPELSHIYYSKSGYYNTSEFFGNKALLLLKRFYRYRIKKTHFVQNFPISSWMKDFCIEQLSKMDYPLSELFNVDSLLLLLSRGDAKPTTEGYWHKFTNPVNIDWNLKHFKNS
jgi:hypothetical protein